MADAVLLNTAACLLMGPTIVKDVPEAMPMQNFRNSFLKVRSKGAKGAPLFVVAEHRNDKPAEIDIIGIDTSKEIGTARGFGSKWGAVNGGVSVKDNKSQARKLIVRCLEGVLA